MGSAISLVAGAVILASAGWLGRYAISVWKGFRHDPHAKSVWWTPGGGVVSHAVSSKEDAGTR